MYLFTPSTDTVLNSVAWSVIVAFKMLAGLALLSANQGGVFGAFPVLWIVIMAVWLHKVTVLSGRFEDHGRVFDVIGKGDVRLHTYLPAVHSRLGLDAAVVSAFPTED